MFLKEPLKVPSDEQTAELFRVLDWSYSNSQVPPKDSKTKMCVVMKKGKAKQNSFVFRPLHAPGLCLSPSLPFPNFWAHKALEAF